MQVSIISVQNTKERFDLHLTHFSVMVFAVVEKAGTVVMNDGEELDSWSVIINGEVRIDTKEGETRYVHSDIFERQLLHTLTFSAGISGGATTLASRQPWRSSTTTGS